MMLPPVTALLYLLPHSALAAESSTWTTRGDGASLYYYADVDECSYVYLYLNVNDTVTHSSESHGPPTSSMGGWFSYDSYNWCTGETLFYVWGDITEDVTFTISPAMKWAVLWGTVTAYDSVTGEETSYELDISWTATSTPYRSMNVYRYAGPYGGSSYHSRDTGRDAAVTGTFLDYTLEDLGVSGGIHQTAYGTHDRWTY